MSDNQMLLRKSVYASSDLTDYVSKLTRAQADAFIDLTTNQSVLFKDGHARLVRVPNRSGRISTIQFGTPITSGASEGVEFTRTVKPTDTSWTYDTVKLGSAMDINTETLEMNIEGIAHKDTLMSMMATKIAEDMERLDINGDTAYGNDGSATYYLLKNYNGWDKLAESNAHVVDFAGAAISKSVFEAMILAMPNYYKQRRSELRFYCGPTVVQNYRSQLASRATGAGDEALTGNAPLSIFGIPIVEVPLFGENRDAHDGSSWTGKGTQIWLTFPGNLIQVLSRDFELYSEFKPRLDQFQLTMYWYAGCTIENYDAFCYGRDVRCQSAT